jgi:hypothetical protein
MTFSQMGLLFTICACMKSVQNDAGSPLQRSSLDTEQARSNLTSDDRAEDQQASLQLLDWADENATAASTTSINLSIKSMGQSTVTVRPGVTIRYRVIGELSDDNNEGLALIGFDLHFEGGPLQQADEPTGEPDAGCENPMIHFAAPWGVTNPSGFGGTVIGGDLIQCGGGQNTIPNDGFLASVLTGVAQPSGCGLAIILTGQLTAPAAPGTYRLVISNVFANVIKEGETGEVFFATEAAGVGDLSNLTVSVSREGSVPSAPRPRDTIK